jgi:hypothetical protein
MDLAMTIDEMKIRFNDKAEDISLIKPTKVSIKISAEMES